MNAMKSDAADERNLAQEQANRALVLDFYDRVFNGHDLAVAEKVLVEDYLQHNPMVGNGKAGFLDFFGALLAENPQLTVRFLRVAAEGDLVWLHVHIVLKPGDLGMAVVDIFRVENGRIAEHWDVMTPIPETTESGTPII